MIIDCHTHFSTFTNEGLNYTEIRDRLLKDMTSEGIVASVVMPDSESGSAVADLDTTLELAAGQSKLFALGTAHVESLGPDVITRLDTLAGEKAISGIKLYPGFEQFYPDDTTCRPLYDICLKYGMPVVFHSGETLHERWREEYNHPWEIARLAEDMPELQIVIAHFSQPHLESCREILTKFPNVHADISGLAHPTTGRTCGTAFIKEVLEETVQEQPEKVLFGTDWPICDVHAHIELVNSLKVSDEARELVFYGNTKRLFKPNVS